MQSDINDEDHLVKGVLFENIMTMKFTGRCMEIHRTRRDVIHAFYNVNLALQNRKANLSENRGMLKQGSNSHHRANFVRLARWQARYYVKRCQPITYHWHHRQESHPHPSGMWRTSNLHTQESITSCERNAMC